MTHLWVLAVGPLLLASVPAAGPMISPEGQRALVTINEREFDEANRRLEAMLAADPASRIAHWAIPALYLGDPERRVADYREEFVREAWAHADVADLEWISIWWLYFELQERLRTAAATDAELAQAEALVRRMEQFTEDYPDDPWGWYTLSILNWTSTFRRDKSEAKRTLQKAMALQPEEARFHLRYTRLAVGELDPIADASRILLIRGHPEWIDPWRYQIAAVVTDADPRAAFAQVETPVPGLGREYEFLSGFLRSHGGTSEQRKLGEERLWQLLRRAETDRPDATTTSTATVLAQRYQRNEDWNKLLEVANFVNLVFADDELTHMLTQQATARYELGDYAGAFFDARQAIAAGQQNPSNYKIIADSLHKMDRIGEAALTYRFYRLRMKSCYARTYKFCQEVEFRDWVRAEVVTRRATLEAFPGVLGPAAIRALLEALAAIAAALFAASRPGRARKYAWRGLLVAEVVFFIALVVVRAEAIETDTGLTASSATWLASVSARAFLLATGGFYLSGLAGMQALQKRATQRGAIVVLILALLGATTVGFLRSDAVRSQDPQRRIAQSVAFSDVGPAVRSAELGVSGGTVSGGLARAVKAILDELTGRLVLPALFAYGVAVLPIFRRRRYRRWVAGAAAVAATSAAFATAGLTVLFSSAAGAGALVSARFYWGLWAAIGLHVSYLAGLWLGGL